MEPNTAMRQRLYKELEHLEEEYQHVELHINSQSNPKIIHIILYDPYNKNFPKNMKFILNNNYPFHPPKILINKEDRYIDWHDTLISYSKIPRIVKYLNIPPPPKKGILNNKWNQTECIYCNYIKNTWSPASRLVTILTQIEEVQIIKREIKYRLVIERICQKYPHPEEITDLILTYIL